MRAVLIVMIVLAAPVRAAVEPETLPARSPSIRYADGRLSVRLARVPLDAVLAAVERETGLVIHGEPLDWRLVTKQFDDLPIARALDRLLGRQNFTLRYDADGEPVRIDLLGLPGPVPEKGRPQKPPTLRAVIARGPGVPVSPTLRRLFGTPTVSLARIMAVAFRNPDPAVRSDARRILIDGFERRAILRDALRRSTPQQIASFLRPWPREYVRELLRDLEIRARDPVLRRVARQTETALRLGATNGAGVGQALR